MRDISHDFSSDILVIPKAGSRGPGSQLFQLRLPARQSAGLVQPCDP
jgi:hypothetical protein